MLHALQVEMQIGFEMFMLIGYFFFLMGLVIAANNVQRIAKAQATEAVVNKILYNLRDIPRVDYKEESSDDEEKEEVEEEVEEKEEVDVDEALINADDEDEDEAPKQDPIMLVKRRRDLNPISRLLDEVD